MDDSEIETPPASTRAISRLAKVVVDERIIRLEGNRTCVICFEDHLLGSYATRLPCQHIFCRSCIVEWLRKNVLVLIVDTNFVRIRQRLKIENTEDRYDSRKKD